MQTSSLSESLDSLPPLAPELKSREGGKDKRLHRLYGFLCAPMVTFKARVIGLYAD
jgi:hypothetical protein